MGCTLNALDTERHLSRPSTDLLPHTNRGRVHQVGATNLDHIIPRISFLNQLGVQTTKRWEQGLMKLERHGYMDSRGDGVVR